METGTRKAERNLKSEDKLRGEEWWEMRETQEWRETNLNNLEGMAEAEKPTWCGLEAR